MVKRMGKPQWKHVFFFGGGKNHYGRTETPKTVIFSRKTHGCWVPPLKETPAHPGSPGRPSAKRQTWVRWSWRSCQILPPAWGALDQTDGHGFFPSQNKKQIKQTRRGGGKEHQTFDFFAFFKLRKKKHPRFFWGCLWDIKKMDV